MKNKILIIFYAYKNLFAEWLSLLDPQKRKIFNKRLKICKECSYQNKKLKTCSICNCPIVPKTRGDYDIDENGLTIYGCPKKYW